MKISIDEVRGQVQSQSGAANGASMDDTVHAALENGNPSLSARVDEIERELRIRIERRARLIAD